MEPEIPREGVREGLESEQYIEERERRAQSSELDVQVCEESMAQRCLKWLSSRANLLSVSHKHDKVCRSCRVAIRGIVVTRC